MDGTANGEGFDSTPPKMGANSCSNGDYSSRRRSSARIQEIKEKRGSDICYYQNTRKKPEDKSPRKRVKLADKAKSSSNGNDRADKPKGVELVRKSPRKKKDLSEPNGVVGGELMKLGLKVEIVDHGSNRVEKSSSLRVKETIRIFNKHLLHYVQEEELRCKTVDSKKNKKEEGKKRLHKRPDLKALTRMHALNEILFPVKQYGAIPGVEVGHQFFSRAEMVAVGLHSHWLNGIDYMGANYCKEEYSGLEFPIAVAIVLSGQYEDDLDNSEDVVYTGQGGNNLLGNKHQIKDQEMKRGNLALKNSMEQSLPVRVVRGHDSKNSYVGRIYTYDGLYKVVKYWAEKGVSGFTVFKYRMKRLEGQPDLTTNQVHFVKGRAPTSVSEVRGLVCADISYGQENIPIPATNLVDSKPCAPTGYKYCKSLEFAENVTIPPPPSGCKCKGMCTDPNVCACAKLNGDDFPYVHRDGGRLIEPKAVVFECGPRCGCGPGCVNRTSQRGIRHRLEVFYTPKKGWGVRSWDYIPSGSPVCEYVGILRRSDEAESVAESNYVFDIDCLQTMKGLDGRERRLRDVSIPAGGSVGKLDDKAADSGPEFCIDAGASGNIARFINHSCEPNLFVQCVLSAHHDIRLARVVLIAADNIPPLQELTYDYGYTIDGVVGADGKIKRMACHCGAPGCKKRMF